MCGVAPDLLCQSCGAVKAASDGESPIVAVIERAFAEQSEADCRAICASCREGRPVEMDLTFRWWVHPSRSSGDPWICSGDTIRKANA